MALTIMSRLSLPSLESAIRIGDIATLAKCPGIGKKTAERLVVELKAKVGGSGAGVPAGTAAERGSPSGPNARRDAMSALVALGYKSADADEAVRRAALALGAEATTEALIKRALAD
jgi:Holliday junction DNA helicase RuvA